MTSGKVRLVHTFRNGSECLRALALDDPATRRLVIIDNLISDISPLNLCDAIRLAHPSLGIVVIAPVDDVEYVQRAMLAGARATISRQASTLELEDVIERVIEAAGGFTPGSSAQSIAAVSHVSSAYGGSEQRGIVVPVIGARGGAGRSTLSSALAYLAAQANIDTALVDFDLQFGDLSFLFDATSKAERTQLGQQVTTEGTCDLSEFFAALTLGSKQGQNVHRNFCKSLAPNLWLYAPRAVPEKTEALAQALPAALDRLRQEHELLILNTGAYWTLLHGELLEHSDLALCVLDQTVVGVRATTELRDLCRRLGIPTSRLLFAMNRVRQSGLCPEEVAEVLSADKVFAVQDAGPELAMFFDSGQLEQVFQQGMLTAELLSILDEIAVRSDLNLHDTAGVRSAMRREGGGRLLSATKKRKGTGKRRGLLASCVTLLNS